jgi:2-keto-4-pentenoate hydratase/2-oxohepta-3-ene-1,7-dioic acid hydratase in catechol pathway
LHQISLTTASGIRHITPSKIVCVGRNFVEHIHELGNDIPDEMVLFVKPNSAISPVLQAYSGEQLHYETELCYVVEQGQLSAVGIGFDLTKRGLQSKLKSKGLPWERAKAFNGSAVFSEFVELPSNSQALIFELDINNNKIQSGNIALMIHKPEAILAYVLSFMDLNDGDIIMTGTPKGVGTINSGDSFAVKLTLAGKIMIQTQWQAK